MRVQVKKLGAGPAGVRRPGDVVDVDREEGEALIADGAAEELNDLAGTAAAETAAAETAEAPPAPRRAIAPPTRRR